MKIASKLKLLGLLPTLLLVGISLLIFFRAYLGVEEAKTLQTVLANNKLLHKTLVELGKERGISTLHLASKENTYVELLKKQRSATDEAIATLKRNLITKRSPLLGFFPSVKNSSSLPSQRYQQILDTLENLSELRSTVDRKGITVQDLFEKRFMHPLTLPILKAMETEERYPLDQKIRSLSSLLDTLYTSQEFLGLSRDFISYFLEGSHPLSREDVSLWSNYHAHSQPLVVSLIDDPQLRASALKTMESPKALKLKETLSEYYRSIFAHGKDGHYQISPIDWFTAFTLRIKLNQQLIDNYAGKADQEVSSLLQQRYLSLSLATALLLVSLILLTMGVRTPREVSNEIQKFGLALKKAANNFDTGDDHYHDIATRLKQIDTDTREGLEKGYQLLGQIVEYAQEDRKLAMEDNEAKSLFLANMSHEIRTPMNGIIGFTELLKSTELNDEQREYANIIEKSSQNLLGIINNILDLSKIESKKVELEHVTFEAPQEFDATVDNFGVVTAEKQIDFYYFLDPTISSHLKSDPTKIKEILTNLLNNAVKFTDPGGEIHVEILKKGEAPSGRALIEFSIRDSGIGMSETQIQKIFQPFTQASGTITRKYGGTGLGLTITKEYVELLGGHLEVESEEGLGSTFRFTLPIEEVRDEHSNLRNHFSGLRFHRVRNDISEKLNVYLDRYAEYFGISFEDFSEARELQNALHNKQVQSIFLEYEALSPSLKEAIEHLPEEELFILARITARKELETYELDPDHLYYKPLTYSKLLSILKSAARQDSQTNTAPITPAKVHTHYAGKALVVEDNIINQKLVRNILEGLGLEVEIANNGLEAFEKRRANQYDIIFMDIQMPVMNGVEATHEILEYEQEEELDHIPIVALTANALKGDRERFLSEGMDEYISKPIEMSELIYILNKFLHDKARVQPIISRKKPEKASGGILIAKKLPFSRKLLSKMLDALEEPYTSTTNFSETQKELEGKKYFLIFADEEMLDRNILDLIRKQKAHVVFTTEPKNRSLLEGIGYTVYHDKMTKESLNKFINSIKGAQ